MVSVSLGIRGASTMSVHNEKATQSSKQRGAPDSNDVRISSMPMAKEENCSCIIMIQAVKGPIHEHVRDAKYLDQKNQGRERAISAVRYKLQEEKKR